MFDMSDNNQSQTIQNNFNEMRSLPNTFFNVEDTWSSDRRTRKGSGRKELSPRYLWYKSHRCGILFGTSVTIILIIVIIFVVISYVRSITQNDPRYKCPTGFDLDNCMRTDFVDYLYWTKSVGYIMNGIIYYSGMAFHVNFPYAQEVSLVSIQNNERHSYPFVHVSSSDSSWFLNVGNLQYNSSFYYNVTYNGRYYTRYSLSSSALSPVVSSSYYDYLKDSTFNWENYLHLDHINKELLLIYQVHIPTYGSQYMNDTIISTTERLDYISNLGINTILLSPIEPAECSYDNSDLCWLSYNILFPGKINPHLASVTDLKTFIKEAHKRLINVIIETNWGLFTQSMFLVDYDVRGVNQGWGIYFESLSEIPAPPGMNHMKSSILSDSYKYIYMILSRYYNEYGIDGIYFTNLMCQRLASSYCKQGNGFDIYSMNTLLSNFTTMFDMYFFADDNMEVYKFSSSVKDVTKPILQDGLAFNAQRNPYFVGNITKSIFPETITYPSIYSLITTTFIYMHSSHIIYIEDETTANTNRFRLLLNSSNIESPVIIKKQLLALIILYSSQSIPLLFMGTEYLSVTQFDPPAIALDIYNAGSYINKQWITKGMYNSYYQFTKDLIKLRSTYAAFRSSTYRIYYNNPSQGLIAYLKGIDRDILVTIINFGTHNFEDGSLFIDFPGFEEPFTVSRYQLILSSDSKEYNPEFTDLARDAIMRTCPPTRSFNYTLCGNIRIAPMSVSIYKPDFTV